MTKKIITTYIRPPIPTTQFDWTAVHEDYDGADDSPDRYHIGYGTTEAEAIEDLLRLDQERFEAIEEVVMSQYSSNDNYPPFTEAEIRRSQRILARILGERDD